MQHRDSRYLDGWPPWVISPFKEKCWLQLLAPGVISHREELIQWRWRRYTCTYSEMRILQLIVYGTLANAGRPKPVKNKKKKKTFTQFIYSNRDVYITIALCICNSLLHSAIAIIVIIEHVKYNIYNIQQSFSDPAISSDADSDLDWSMKFGLGLGLRVGLKKSWLSYTLIQN
jgi:hypothetical protein